MPSFEQAPLFDWKSAPLPADQQGNLRSLQARTTKGIKLSPTQRKFNKLLSQLENLNLQKQALETWTRNHLPQHHEQMEQLYQKERFQLRNFVIQVEQMVLKSKKITKKGRLGIQYFMEKIFDRLDHTHDPDLERLYNQYCSTQETENEAWVQHMREQIISICTDVLEPEQIQYLRDLEVDLVTLQDKCMQLLDEHIKKKEKNRKEKTKARAQKKAPQQGTILEDTTPPPLSTEQDAKQTIRIIYRQLARTLHPDRETDPTRQAEKTELMGQVNAAYERMDLSTLLKIQLQLAQINPSDITAMADDRLLVMCHLLKEQANTLQNEVELTRMQTCQLFNIPPFGLTQEHELLNALEEKKNRTLRRIASIEKDLLLCTEWHGFKSWSESMYQTSREHERMENDLTKFIRDFHF